MYSDKIMRAIKTHYPKDFEILKGILQTIPLSCKLMMKGGAEYMFVDTKEDEIGYEIIDNKNAKNFAISFYSPFSYMEAYFSPTRVDVEFSIDRDMEDNDEYSLGTLKGMYGTEFKMSPNGSLTCRRRGNRHTTEPIEPTFNR